MNIMQRVHAQQGKRLRIFIGEAEIWHGKPLYQSILNLATQYRVMRVTVLRGIEGFGPEHHLSTERLVDLADNLPIIVEIIDTTEQIGPLLAQLDPLVQRGMITITSVEIIQGQKEQG
jgi:PII-like signaling protein